MTDPSRIDVLNSPEHQKLAYDAAIEGLVLLQNGNKSATETGVPVLPLLRHNFVQSPNAPMTISFIGPNAGCTKSGDKCDSISNMLGPYTQYNGGVTVKTVFEAAQGSALPSDVIKFARGCDIDNTKTDQISRFRHGRSCSGRFLAFVWRVE
eukprot:m.280819 g.280819  ORF g.280819 m.280819 type:complete len:152 (+) comp40636_c0_seq12:1190-1645(+)